MKTLVVNNLVKSYKAGEKALKGINLEVCEGDIFAFIGHNGAGKTTAIKCIAGILNFEEGEILIANKNVKKEPIACKRLTAYVPDNPDLYGYMTGMEFLKFILTIYKIDNKNNEFLQSLCKEYEIFESLNTKIQEYSHGMKQKLIIITAFLRKPKLMILDEPFVGLDPTAAKITKDKMKDFCTEGGAIFYSTHVLETAERLSNKVAIIKEGQIVHEGNMEETIRGKTLEDIFMESK